MFTTIDQQPIAKLSKADLVEKVVGRSLGLEFPERKPPTDAPNILEVKNMQLDKDSPKVDFTLKKGEILGVFGLVGAGRTEIMRALLGIDSCHNKEVIYKGTRINISDPGTAYKYGIGLLPEDRKSEGLLLPFSVTDNISLNNLPNGIIRYKKLYENAFDKIKKLSIKTPNQLFPVVNLSGGNQQKVVLAKCLSTSPRVLIIDEPTNGIDVGAKSNIHKLIRSLSDEGLAVIVVSSDLLEVLAVSDRVVVMKKGRMSAVLENKNLSQNDVMKYAI